MLNWQIGVEIELIAPRGLSRETLARKLCPMDGSIKRFFHPQSEPSKVPNLPTFENLTLGFEVFDRDHNLIAKCVDDLTLQQDCQKNIPAKSGWYRIVSDDRRLLELVIQQSNPENSLDEVLNPIAQLFSTKVQVGSGNMFKVVDNNNLSIAIATPLPGERERPCEIITPILNHDYHHYLDHLLSTAVDLGFTIPYEGATHIHFDAQPLADTRVFANLVNLFWTYGDILRQLVGCNLNCQRLGKMPFVLLKIVNDDRFKQLSWQEARIQLQKLQLSKYNDFNLKNIVEQLPNKNTLEVRILPVWLEAQKIILTAELIQSILYKAIETESIDFEDTLSWNIDRVVTFLNNLNLESTTNHYWQEIAESNNCNHTQPDN